MHGQDLKRGVTFIWLWLTDRCHLWFLVNPLVSSDFFMYVISASHHQGFWIWFPFMQGVLDTTLCDAVCQCLVSRLNVIGGKSEDKVKKIIYFFMYRLYYTRWHFVLIVMHLVFFIWPLQVELDNNLKVISCGPPTM
jgi:ABC-type Fe3+-siderophore transport system permease subunit